MEGAPASYLGRPALRRAGSLADLTTENVRAAIAHGGEALSLLRYSDASTITQGYISRQQRHEQCLGKIGNICRARWPSDRFEVESMVDSGVRYDAVRIKRLLHDSITDRHGNVKHVNTGDFAVYFCRLLRIDDPRGEFANDVAASEFARSIGPNIPTPECVTYDLSKSDWIGSAFAIQRYKLGISIAYAWAALDKRQKISVARQLGAIVADLQRVSFQSAGRLRNPTAIIESGIHRSEFRVAPEFVPFSATSEQDVATLISPKQTFAEFLRSQLQWRRQIAAAVNHNRDADLYHLLSEVVRQMEEHNLFKPNMLYNLTHRDLRPENILIIIDAEGKAVINAVVGWERAASLPTFMGLKPLSWLWRWNEKMEEKDNELSERFINLPESDDLWVRAIKGAYDSSFSTIQKQYAYDGPYRLAREITRIAVDGIGGPDNDLSKERRTEVESIIDLWGKFRTSNMEQRLEDEASGRITPRPYTSTLEEPSKMAAFKEKSKTVLKGATNLLKTKKTFGNLRLQKDSDTLRSQKTFDDLRSQFSDHAGAD